MVELRTVELEVTGINPDAGKFFRAMLQRFTSARVYKNPTKHLIPILVTADYRVSIYFFKLHRVYFKFTSLFSLNSKRLVNTVQQGYGFMLRYLFTSKASLLEEFIGLM